MSHHIPRAGIGLAQVKRSGREQAGDHPAAGHSGNSLIRCGDQVFRGYGAKFSCQFTASNSVDFIRVDLCAKAEHLRCFQHAPCLIG